jgi:hypothetical protein
MSGTPAPAPRGPRCHRLILGHAHECPTAHGLEHLERWCPVCLEAYDRWCDEQAQQAAWDAQHQGPAPAPIPAEPPCPLDAHQAAAWADWLALGDRPAWSFEQVSWPSPN